MAARAGASTGNGRYPHNILTHRHRGAVIGAAKGSGTFLYFKGIAGNRFGVLFAGSTIMPTDSSAVTPSNGSHSDVPKITRPAVTSPMNSIRTKPYGYSLTDPSANSYDILPSRLTPILSISSAGAIVSVAPVSTRKTASYLAAGCSKLIRAVVTFSQTHPCPPRSTHLEKNTRD
jgi:hypothetical protein